MGINFVILRRKNILLFIQQGIWSRWQVLSRILGCLYVFQIVKQKLNLLTWKGNLLSRCSVRAYYSANASFKAGQCPPVRAHRQQVPKAGSLAAEHRRTHCKQDEWILHHLAMQYEAHAILLQETHCICADKLTIPGFALAGPSLSRKYGLTTFVPDRIKWILVDQSPATSESEWLCVDVDGCRMVNVCKPPPTRLQASDLPVFPYPVFHAGYVNCPHVNWGYKTSSVDGECLVAWASHDGLVPLHDPKEAATFHSGR